MSLGQNFFNIKHRLESNLRLNSFEESLLTAAQTNDVTLLHITKNNHVNLHFLVVNAALEIAATQDIPCIDFIHEFISLYSVALIPRELTKAIHSLRTRGFIDASKEIMLAANYILLKKSLSEEDITQLWDALQYGNETPGSEINPPIKRDQVVKHLQKVRDSAILWQDLILYACLDANHSFEALLHNHSNVGMTFDELPLGYRKKGLIQVTMSNCTFKEHVFNELGAILLESPTPSVPDFQSSPPSSVLTQFDESRKRKLPIQENESDEFRDKKKKSASDESSEGAPIEDGDKLPKRPESPYDYSRDRFF